VWKKESNSPTLYTDKANKGDNSMLPEEDTQASIFNEIKSLNDTQRKVMKEEENKSYFRGEKVLMWAPIFSSIAAIILNLVSNLLKTHLLFQISLFFLVISYLAVVVSQSIIIPIWFWTSTRKILRNPLGAIINNAMKYAAIDATHVSNLCKYEPDALKSVLVELKAERAAWERRTSLLVGAIEKVGIIGIIPGLFALSKSVNLGLIPGFPVLWIQVLAYATPLFYGLGFMSHTLMMRFDRFIMLIEMIIEGKK